MSAKWNDSLFRFILVKTSKRIKRAFWTILPYMKTNSWSMTGLNDASVDPLYTSCCCIANMNESWTDFGLWRMRSSSTGGLCQMLLQFILHMSVLYIDVDHFLNYFSFYFLYTYRSILISMQFRNSTFPIFVSSISVFYPFRFWWLFQYWYIEKRLWIWTQYW